MIREPASAVAVFCRTLALGVAVFSAPSAMATPVTLTAPTASYNSINSSGNIVVSDGIYTLSPLQGAIDALFQFDLSAYSGVSLSGGTLTLTEQQLHTPNTALSATLSLYALTAAFSVGTFPSLGAVLDTETLAVIGAVTPTPVSFVIPDSVLAGWAAVPATNFGFLLLENSAYSTDQGVNVGHSDIVFYAPIFVNNPASLSFTTNVVEPGSLTLLAMGVFGLAMRRGRTRAA